MRRLDKGFALALTVLVATAHAASGQVASSNALPGNVVDVKAGEFFFQAPDTIPGGLTTFRLLQVGLVVERLAAGVSGRDAVSDKGDDTRGGHMLWVVRLDSGKTVADLHRAAVANEPTPAWTRAMGGPVFIFPPKTTNATIDLPPGNYALVCYIGSARPDRTRYHLLHGMVRALTVVPSAKRWSPPAVDVIATISPTRAITLSQPPRAGSVVFRVDNQSDREIEFKLHRVPDGMTGEAFLAQPGAFGEPFGGLSSVPPKASVITTLDLPPGAYIVGNRPSLRHASSIVVRIPPRAP